MSRGNVTTPSTSIASWNRGSPSVDSCSIRPTSTASAAGWATGSIGAGRPSWGPRRGGCSRPRSARSRDGERVHRRADGAGERQRRRHEEELVDARVRAVLGQLVEREDLADQHAHVGDEDLVDWLVAVGNLVGAYFHAPGVGGDRRQLVIVEPADARKRESRRIAAGVVTPAPLLLAHRHLPGADEQRVAGAERHVVRAHGRVEIVGRDRVAGLEPREALDARDVEQDAAGDHAAGHRLDAVLLGALAADEVGVVAVVELAVEEAV